MQGFAEYKYLLITFISGFIMATIFWRFYWLTRKGKRFKKQSRAVIKGLVNEQLAPYLPDFPFQPTEAKFLGNPIDLIIFQGLDNENVDEIVFVEIKSGKHRRLTKTERSIRDTVKKKNISWYQYNQLQ